MKFLSLFKHNRTVETLSLEELVGWHLFNEEGKLLLPPIQRSLVWSNTQIINYWDSLLRGYPAGMIMVHRSKSTGENPRPHGRDEMGKTRLASANDWQLFDGQQRLSSILLGLGLGKWPASRKLWIDVAKDPGQASELKFQLRISSTGQPFGYRLEEPNQKLELRKRQQKWAEWKRTHPNIREDEAFEKVQGQDLIDAERALPLSEICASVRQSSDFAPLFELNATESSRLHGFIEALRRLFNSEIVVRLVDDEIVEHPDEYIRLFGRLGQGGTALSNDEFTYSMIKYRYPSVHDQIQHVMTEAGRLAGEVDLVLGTLRVAKTLAPREEAEVWRIISRPTPAFVSELDTWVEAKERFLSLMSCRGQPAARPGELEQALIAIRYALAHSGDSPNGLPPMLLARFPAELVDVLILLGVKKDCGRHWSQSDRSTLQAFTLHWLIFVMNNEKAAGEVFKQALKSEWDFSQLAAQEAIGTFEKEGFALFMPRPDAMEKLKEGLVKSASSNGLLRSWADRFTEADRAGAHTPGEALRILSTNTELIKRALMWLQRDYLVSRFPHYDPTSSRDEDLPVDLDHIIPHSLFGDHWTPQQKRLDNSVDKDNFWNQRQNIGNSLGNYRWLCASENRRRKAGGLSAGRQENPGSLQLEERQDAYDLVSNPAEWNTIIPERKEDQRWSASDIAKFQFLIDMRTLELYERLFTVIEGVLPVDDAA